MLCFTTLDLVLVRKSSRPLSKRHQYRLVFRAKWQSHLYGFLPDCFKARIPDRDTFKLVPPGHLTLGEFSELCSKFLGRALARPRK